MLRSILATVVLLAGCSSSKSESKSASPLQSVLPKTIEGHKPIVLEDSSGIVAMYARDAKASINKDNPVVRISIVAPAPIERENGLVAGWHKPRPDDAMTDIVDQDYRGHKAQLIRSRNECGDTMLGKPVDPTKCSTDVTLAVRLTNDRVLIVEKMPAITDKDVFAIVDALDLAAVDAAAQPTVAPASIPK